MDDIRNQVVARIAMLAEIPPASVKDDVPLRDLGVDSLMALDIVAFIEERFHIDIPDEEVSKVRTLRDIMLRIQKRAGEPRDDEA